MRSQNIVIVNTNRAQTNNENFRETGRDRFELLEFSILLLLPGVACSSCVCTERNYQLGWLAA